MRRQWALALLVIGLLGPCVFCKKKQAKRDPSTLVKPKAGKRWMAPNGFGGFPSREADMAFDDHFAAQEVGYNTGPPQDPYSVPAFSPNVGQAIGIKDPTPFKNNDEDGTSAAAYAQEVATYLKPGIGDYPSDMPAGYKGDLGLGLPIGGKIKGNKMAPISSFAHPEPPDLLHEFKDKSESNELLAGTVIHTESGFISNKTDEGPIPGLENAKIAADKVKEKEKEDKKKPVTGARRQGELYQLPMMTSNYEPVGLPQVNPPQVFGGGPGGGGDDTTVAAANSEDSPSSLDAGENAESSLPAKAASAKNEEEDKESASEAKEDEPAAGAKGAKVAKEESKEDAAASNDQKTPGAVKQKLVSSLRQALLENIGDMMNKKAGDKDKDDKEEEGSGDAGAEKAEDSKAKEPSAVGAKNTGNSKETEKAAPEEAATTPDKAAATDDKASEDKAEKAAEAAADDKLEKAEESDKEGSKATSAENEPTRAAADEQKTQMLEANLMKIDKKKLVHLLATLMQKNKKEMEEEESDEEEDDDKGKGTEKSKASHNPDKVKEAVAAEASEAAKSEEDKQPSFSKGGKSEKAGKEAADEDAKTDDAQQEEPSKQAPKEEAAEKVHKQRSSKPTALAAAVMAIDPYAQIGLVDPSNNDKSLSFSKDSVHPKHAKEVDAESAKEEDSSKEETKEEESPKASAKLSKEEDDEKEESPKMSSALMEARVQAIQEAKQLAKMKLLAKEEKAKQELKAIQKMEKDADEKEAEEAGEDAQSVNDAPKEKEKEKPTPKIKLANFKALATPTGAHLSPALVQAIAENLQNGGLAALAGGGKAKESSASESSKVKEAAHEAKESKSAKEESEDEDKEDEADQAPDGPNIQTLIQHMKERLKSNGSGGKKQSSQSAKSKRRGKSFYDDAYAQIGAMDPNIKKKKNLIHHKVHRHHHSSD